MKMVSKTLVKKHRRKKTNPQLAMTIALALKQKSWLHIAKRLAGATRSYVSVNLMDIDKQTSTGDTVLVPGRVLSMGDITKKVRVCALGFSAGAREKLKKSKSEAVTIADEIKANPKAEGIKIIA